MKAFFTIGAMLICQSLLAQNLGVGTTTPAEKLDVNGNIKVGGAIIKTGGNPFDFLQKINASGQVGFRKGHGAIGLRYIICVTGFYPSPEVFSEGPYMSEVKLFAGDFAPQGWMFCEGQILPINQNQALFSLLQFYYGGNGVTTFALPDLRGATTVGFGTSVIGNTWNPGQKSN